jgi:broad specificity phosphatase PhoE
MRIFEMRRHAEGLDASDQGSHLSQAGVDMARKTGESSGPFALAVASPIPRAIDTAIAMGFSVREQLPRLAEYPMAVHTEVRDDDSLAAFGRAYALGRATADYADRLAQLLASLVTRVDDGERVLVVSHGGIVEASAIGMAPSADHREWGANFAYCEGFRACFDGGVVSAVEMLRVR